jgi:capsular exopolysaccharide synthesis family protein
MDLGRYFDIVKRWWWLVLVSVALAAGASYVYSDRQPRIYASRTTLMVGTSIQSTNPDLRDLGLSRTLAEIYGQLVLRKPITQAVIDKLGLDMSTGQLAGMISTKVVPDVQLLEITVLDVDPQRAQILADAVAQELILQSPTEAQEQQTARQFIYAQLQELQSKIEEASRQVKEAEDSMLGMTSAADIAEAKSRLAELQALKSDYQANYTSLLGYLSDSSINSLTIVEPATISTRPIAPNVKKNVLIAALAGLALSVSAVLLLEFATDSLTWHAKGPQTVAGVPILGALGKLSASDKVIARKDLWSPEADAIRNMRTNIFLSMRDREVDTMLISSPEMREGKTLTSVNLAAITASGGSTTIVVDADLRKPSVHELFDLPNLFGLADVLTASEEAFDETLDGALQSVDIANLWVLPAGKVPIDPTLLLGSPNMTRLIDCLRERAKLVIFDCGPMLLHPDAAILATRVDAALLVVRQDQSSRRATQKAVGRFASLGLTNLAGIVFNEVSLPRSYYLYSHRAKPGKATPDIRRGHGWLGRFGLPFGQGQHAQVDDGMLSSADVAEYLGVTEATAARWCETGRISAVKIGRQWWVRTEDLRQFVLDYGSNHGLGEIELAEV